MEDNIKLRLDYKKLICEGKKEEAKKILKKIWAKKPNPIIEKEGKKVIVETKKKEKKESKFNKLSDLTNINGLGKKSLKDIERQFNTIDELKESLGKDNVSLRDDIVEKLKEELI